MSSKAKRRQKQNDRAQDGAKAITALLDNTRFIEGYGHYIRIGEGFVYPKYQDILYQKRDTAEPEKLISEQIQYVVEQFGKAILPGGDSIYFLVPLSAVIALPSPYKANRIISKNKTGTKAKRIFSVTLINAAEVQKQAVADQPAVFYGISFALIGVQSDTNIAKNKYMDYYLESVAYLNDFITAWKLFRHDHTVENVTPRTLPEVIDYYHLKQGRDRPKQGALRVHGNDLADLWAKRLPESPATIESSISRLCEYLPTNPLAHYALRVGERATTNFCLGQYEDCIINADRFVELALRDILRYELNLSDTELGEYKTIYSTNPRVKAVVQTLARQFSCEGDATISKWYSKAREVRNKIIHKLDVSSITPDEAKDALQYNFKIVNLMAKKASNDFEWYSMMNDNFFSLFEEPIE